jgi:hypothetical protein
MSQVLPGTNSGAKNGNPWIVIPVRVSDHEVSVAGRIGGQQRLA